MSKNTKKRTMIYSNVKENKRRAEELSKIRANQINLNDEVIIGLSNSSPVQENKSKNTQKKTHPTKKKKMSKKNKKMISLLLKIIIIVAIIVVGIILLTRSSAFNISEVNIKIENNNILTESEILELSQISVGQNMYSMSKGDIAELIKSNPYVEDVKIKRSLPNKIQIIVNERSVRFQLKNDNEYIYVDNQGYILERGTKKDGVVIITGYESTDLADGSRLSVKDLEKLSDVIQIMQEADNNGIKDDITQISIEDDYDYKLYFDNQGKVAHLGTVNSINDKLTYIKKIIEIESDYEGDIFVNVDLNNGEYPYFREKV